jgi:hypothetical protein
MASTAAAPLRPCSNCGGRTWQRWGGDPIGGWVCAVCRPAEDAAEVAQMRALRVEIAAEMAAYRQQWRRA